MSFNFLILNSDKTEVKVFGPQHLRSTGTHNVCSALCPHQGEDSLHVTTESHLAHFRNTGSSTFLQLFLMARSHEENTSHHNKLPSFHLRAKLSPARLQCATYHWLCLFRSHNLLQTDCVHDQYTAVRAEDGGTDRNVSLTDTSRSNQHECQVQHDWMVYFQSCLFHGCLDFFHFCEKSITLPACSQAVGRI